MSISGIGILKQISDSKTREANTMNSTRVYLLNILMYTFIL